MEADWLEVLWVVGLARTREGGVREHATVAVLKPREEGMGRGGPARLMLREGGGVQCTWRRGRRGPMVGSYTGAVKAAAGQAPAA
jgi:hypothetical protein